MMVRVVVSTPSNTMVLVAEAPKMDANDICSLYVPGETVKVTGPATPQLFNIFAAAVNEVKFDAPLPEGFIVNVPDNPVHAVVTIVSPQTFASGFTLFGLLAQIFSV